MLGHANLETTQVYTLVAIDKLIAVHRATHPSRLQRRAKAVQGAHSPLSGPSLDEAREALLGAIAADGEDVDEARETLLSANEEDEED